MDPTNAGSAWSQQFTEDKRVTDFNMEMAKNANKGGGSDIGSSVKDFFGGGSSADKFANGNANIITAGGWGKFNKSTGGKYQAFNSGDPRAMPTYAAKNAGKDNSTLNYSNLKWR